MFSHSVVNELRLKYCILSPIKVSPPSPLPSHNIIRLILCSGFSLPSLHSQPRTKQKYGSHENEGLSGMLKLCTAVMRHDPSFKMSTDGLVSDF